MAHHSMPTQLTKHIISMSFRLTLAVILSAALALTGIPFQLVAYGSQQTTALSDGAALSISHEDDSDGIIIEFDKAALASLEEANGLMSLQSNDSEVMDDVSPDDIQQLLAQPNAAFEVDDVLGCFDGSLLVQATSPAQMTDERAAQEVQSLPYVKSAQPNYTYALIDDRVDENELLTNNLDMLTSSLQLPNDPYLQEPDSTRANNQYWAYSAKLPEAWNISEQSGNVTVALMDTAVEMSHRDLASNLLVDFAYNATDEDYLSNAPLPAMSHGTMTAGIISAVSNNDFGIAGASNNAKVLPIAVFDENGSSSTARLVNAFLYLFSVIADHSELNIKVVNISAGRYASTNIGNDALLQTYIDIAREKYGIITVAAGGNGYDNALMTPRTDRLIPSDFPNVVSVTALEPDKTNVFGSDYNMNKNISASGIHVYSTSLNNSLASASGTSLSAPIVSGALALMFASAPDSKPDQIVDALYKSADAIIDDENDRSKVSGSHGALNAYMAVICAKVYQSDPFHDVSSQDWFYMPVAFNKHYSIMNGIAGSKEFQPSRGLTRAEAACVLYNYANPTNDSEPCKFTDVDQGAWYAKGVNWACSNGVMNGYTNSNRFGPNDLLTREQMACIIANYARNLYEPIDYSKYESFSDKGNTSSWAQENVAWAVSKGVINGVESDGKRTISPDTVVSRAQMAAIIMNSITSEVLN